MQCHVECGCSAGGPCCLSCPLPECIYVTGEHPTTLRSRKRQDAVVVLYSAGMSMRKVAAQIGIDPRTVGKLWKRHLAELDFANVE